MEPPQRLLDQLAGREGNTRQKAARLVIDLADTANADGYLEVRGDVRGARKILLHLRGKKQADPSALERRQVTVRRLLRGRARAVEEAGGGKCSIHGARGHRLGARPPAG